VAAADLNIKDRLLQAVRRDVSDGLIRYY
jgi:hypothetical protein